MIIKGGNETMLRSLGKTCIKAVALALSALLVSPDPSVFAYSAMGAEELFFADIAVITASKNPEPIDAAPNVMYVVTKEEIKKYGLQDIRSVLSRIPGFFTPYGHHEQLAQIRGIAPIHNNKISYMLNGHRINNVNETTNLVWPFNLDNVERIEIIVGPGAVLYPAENLAAMVNMITKKGDLSEVNFSAGSRESYSTTAQIGKTYGENRNFYASASWTESKGFWSEAYNRHSGERIDAAGTDVFSKKLDIVRPSAFLFAQAQLDDWSFETSSTDQGLGEYEQNREDLGVKATRYNYVDSMVVRNRKALGQSVTRNFEFSYDQKRLMRAIERGAPGSILDTHQKLYGVDLSYQFSLDKHFFQTGLQANGSRDRHNFEMKGIGSSSVDYEIISTTQIVTTDPSSASRMMDEKNRYTVGAYFSEQYKVNDALSLTGAFRLDRSDYANKKRTYVSPRVAITAKPADRWTLKLFSNRATKFAGPWESDANRIWNIHYVPYNAVAGFPATRGPASRPEILTTYELQSIHYLGRTRLAVNVYKQELQDMIAWGASHTNIGNFNGKGLELDVKSPIGARSNVWLNGAWQKSRFHTNPGSGGDHGAIQNPDGEMNAVPEYTFNVGGEHNIRKNLSLTATVRSFMNQVVRRYDIPPFTMTRAQWEAYLAQPGVYKWEKTGVISYLDAAIVWQNVLANKLDLRVSGKNILNNRDRLSMQYANGDYQPEGSHYEMTAYYKF
jgi:outer membrane receptor protein involved in Fe transport